MGSSTQQTRSGSFRVVALAKHGNVRKRSVAPNIDTLASNYAENAHASLLATVNTSHETGISVIELDVTAEFVHSEVTL